MRESPTPGEFQDIGFSNNINGFDYNNYAEMYDTGGNSYIEIMSGTNPANCAIFNLPALVAKWISGGGFGFDGITQLDLKGTISPGDTNMYVKIRL